MKSLLLFAQLAKKKKGFLPACTCPDADPGAVVSHRIVGMME
jgi:hypothetical protein